MFKIIRTIIMFCFSVSIIDAGGCKKHPATSATVRISSKNVVVDDDALLQAYREQEPTNTKKVHAVLEPAAKKTEIQNAINVLLSTVHLHVAIQTQEKKENSLSERIWQNIKPTKLNALIQDALSLDFCALATLTHLTKYHKLNFEYQNTFTLMVFCELFTRTQRTATPVCLAVFRNEVRMNYQTIETAEGTMFHVPIGIKTTPKQYHKHLALQMLGCYPQDEEVQSLKLKFVSLDEMLGAAFIAQLGKPHVLVEFGDKIEEGLITTNPMNNTVILPDERLNTAAEYFDKAILRGLYNRANHLGVLIYSNSINRHPDGMTDLNSQQARAQAAAHYYWLAIQNSAPSQSMQSYSNLAHLVSQKSINHPDGKTDISTQAKREDIAISLYETARQYGNLEIDEELIDLYVNQYYRQLHEIAKPYPHQIDAVEKLRCIETVYKEKLPKLEFQNNACALFFRLLLEMSHMLIKNIEGINTATFKATADRLKDKFYSVYTNKLTYIINMAYAMEPRFSLPYFLDGVKLGIIDFIPLDVLPADIAQTLDDSENEEEEREVSLINQPVHPAPLVLSYKEKIERVNKHEVIGRGLITEEETALFHKKLETYYKTLEKLKIRKQKTHEFAERAHNPFGIMNSFINNQEISIASDKTPIEFVYTKKAKNQYDNLPPHLQQNIQDIEKDIQRNGRCRNSEVLGDRLLDGTPLISLRINEKHRFIYTRKGQKITVYQVDGHYDD